MSLLAALALAAMTGVFGLVVGFLAGRGAGAAQGPRQLPGGLEELRALPATLGPGALPSPPMLKDLRQGGLVGVPGFGDAFEDVQLEIERYTRYTRGREEWHELSATYKSRAVALDWELERGELFLYAVKRLRGEKLSATGIDLAALQATKPGETLEVAGAPWTLTGAGKTLSHDNGIGFGKELTSWELKSADRKQLLRIERWGDEEPAVSRGERLDPASITIFRSKG